MLDEFAVNDGSFYTTVKGTNLRAQTIKGNTLPVVMDNSNQTFIKDDEEKTLVDLRRPGSYLANIYYSNTSSSPSYKDAYGRQNTDSASYVFNGKDWAVNGFGMSVAWGFTHSPNGDIENRLIASNSLAKFDSRALKLTGQIHLYDYMNRMGNYGYTLKIMYATKEDGKAWISDEEMKNTKMEELKYFSSLSDAEKNGEVIGIMIEIRPSGSAEDVLLVPSTHTLMSAVCNVRNDKSLWDNVYMTCVGNKVWRAYDYDDNNPIPSLLTNDPQKPTVLPESTITDYPTYTPAKYDEHGYKSGHTGNFQRGDSLYIVPYQAKITKEVAQKENDNTSKQIYDLDYYQRVVDYRLKPSTVLANNQVSDLKTSVTITDKLGKGLTYRKNSAYYGGTYVQNTKAGYPGTVTGGTKADPQSIINNADGTTTIIWVIKDVVVGAPMEELYYSADIGAPGDSVNDVGKNATLTNDVQIKTPEDKREISKLCGNFAEADIRVSRLGSLSHSKVADQVMNERGSKIGYTLNLGNNGDNAVPDTILMDILPYNGDKNGSAFKGPLKVMDWEINTTTAKNWQDWEVYYTENTAVRNTTAADYLAAGIRNGAGSIAWTKVTINNVDGTISGLDGKEPTAVVFVGDILAGDTCKIHMNMQAEEAESGSKFANNLYFKDISVTSETYYVSRKLSGLAWDDFSGDGCRDTDENVIPGITVTLLKDDGTGKYIPVKDKNGIVITTKTGKDGKYTFTGLEQGNYGVQFGTGTELKDYIPSKPNVSEATEECDSDGIPEYNTDGSLKYTLITGIEMPTLEEFENEIGTYLYESKNHDTGLYKRYNATYEYVSSTPGMNLPQEIIDMLPADQSDIKDRTEITASQPEKTTVIDDANDGTWTFDGWDESTQTIDGEDIHFIGRWTFTPNKYKATHEFESGTPGKDLPKDVLDLLPGDKTGFKNNETADATKPEKTEVKVEDGTWTFVSWDEESKKIEGSDVEFLGKWVFTPDEPEPKKIVSADSAAGAEGTAVQQGDEITYEITFMNTTEKTVEVTVVDPLVSAVDFIEASEGSSYDSETHTVTWKFTEVKPYERGKVTIKVRVNETAEGEIVNTASVKIGDKNYDIPEPPSNALEATSLRVTKVWDDDDDKAGKRPKSINVDLYCDGEVVDQVVLSEENNWTATFDDLPLGTTTDSYSYEVREQAVDDYTAKYTKVSTEWMIVNKYTEGVTDPGTKPGKKTTSTSTTTTNSQNGTSSVTTKLGGSNPKTGDTTNMMIWGLILVGSGCILTGMINRRLKKN